MELVTFKKNIPEHCTSTRNLFVDTGVFMGHNRWINEELTGYDILKSFLNTYSGVKAKGFQAVLNKEAVPLHIDPFILTTQLSLVLL